VSPSIRRTRVTIHCKRIERRRALYRALHDAVPNRANCRMGLELGVNNQFLHLGCQRRHYFVVVELKRAVGIIISSTVHHADLGQEHARDLSISDLGQSEEPLDNWSECL